MSTIVCSHGSAMPDGGWLLPDGMDEEGSEEFYMACDCCGYPMSHGCAEIYHNQETGETLCSMCEPKPKAEVSQK